MAQVWYNIKVQEMIPQLQKFRHKPTEVYAYYLMYHDEADNPKGQKNFPIPLIVSHTETTELEGMLGPITVMRVEWTDPSSGCTEEELIPENYVALAHKYENSDALYITFTHDCTFVDNYELIE